jgi:hypothetical protein
MIERFAAWLITGPIGHLASGLADWGTLVRAAIARRVRRFLIKS